MEVVAAVVAAKTQYGLSAARVIILIAAVIIKRYQASHVIWPVRKHSYIRPHFSKAPSIIRLFVALLRRIGKNRLSHAITWLNLTSPFLRGLNPGIESKSECTSSLTCRIGPFAPRFWSIITEPMIRSNPTSLTLCPQPRREFVCCSSMATHFTARPYIVNLSKPIMTTPSTSLPEPSMKVPQPFSATVVNFKESKAQKGSLKENMNGCKRTE
jgi:hypothetical protein